MYNQIVKHIFKNIKVFVQVLDIKIGLNKIVLNLVICVQMNKKKKKKMQNQIAQHKKIVTQMENVLVITNANVTVDLLELLVNL